MILLDSDFLIDILIEKEEAVKKLETIRQQHMTISIVTYMEILYGKLKKDKKDDLDLLLSTIEVIPFGLNEATEAAMIRIELENGLGRIGLADEMIAGTAIANNAAILTRNVKHFSRIKGLKVETW